MLPVAKALVITVLLGGGAVGTYALAGGKFGTGSSGSGNAETAQTSTTESTTPSTDGQSTPRVEETAPSAPREGETVEERAQDEGSSVTLAGTNEGKDTGSTDASASPRVEPEKALEATDSSHPTKSLPEIRSGEETTSTEGQQKDSQKEAVPANDGQEPAKPETPVVSGNDDGREKGNLDAGSNEPGSVKDIDADSQTGIQNTEVISEKEHQENVPSPNNQVAGESSSTNTAQNVQSAVGSAQDKGNADRGNQANVAVTADSNTNTGGSSPEEQAQA